MLGTLTRRGFLASSIAAAALPKLTITAVELWRFEGERDALAGANRQHQVQPLHIYEEHRPKEYSEPPSPKQTKVPVAANYLKLKTDAGLEGTYGPVDSEAVPVINRQLKPLITGKDGLAGETLWDQMHRSNRHSRAGAYMMAISAIDNALWDLRGQYHKTPVYRLLGGPTRSKVEAYCSALGHSVQPAPARAKAAEFKKLGFHNQKWFLAYGPGDGLPGLKKNVELVRNLRQAVGDDVDIMFDAFMGWNLDYAIAWAKQVEQFRPRWIEEAFHVSKIDSFVQLRKSTSVPVATGEHFYNRWEAQEFLKAGAISVVQADPEWCGGVSELVKICSIGSVYDAQVIPHGHNIHAALHVVASQSPMTCPLVEYLYSKMQSYYHFDKNPPTPVNGFIELSDRPGFGMELDDAKILKRTLLT
jgi:L-rhamnonate dehydratase